MAYATGTALQSGDAATIFEMQMGMVDRGADLTWLSQYPQEREVLLPPLTGLEALEHKVQGGMLVIQSRLSLNMAAHTLEQVGPCLASPSPASPSPAHPARPNPARPSPARPNPARPRPARPSPVSPNLRTKRAFALAPTRDQARICPSSNPPLGPSHCKPALERTGALSPAQDADGHVCGDRA